MIWSDSQSFKVTVSIVRIVLLGKIVREHFSCLRTFCVSLNLFKFFKENLSPSPDIFLVSVTVWIVDVVLSCRCLLSLDLDIQTPSKSIRQDIEGSLYIGLSDSLSEWSLLTHSKNI